jgi:ferredoxin
MPNITFISNGGMVVTAPVDSNLLRVSLREKGGIPFKCGGGLCGTCKCRIEVGLENTDAVKPKEKKHLTAADLAAGFRMACQTFIKGDIGVSWEPRKAAAAVSAAIPDSKSTDAAATEPSGEAPPALASAPPAS